MAVLDRRAVTHIISLAPTLAAVTLTAAFLTCFAAADDGADLAKMSADEAWEYAEELMRDGKTSQAMKAYQYIVDHHPDNEIRAPWALYRMCMISYNERQIEDALAYIQKAVDEYPESGICKSGYAASYLTAIYLIFSKDYQAGIDVAKEHLEKFGGQMHDLERARIVERMAKSHIELGDHEGAKEALNSYLLDFPHLLASERYYETMFDIQIAQKDSDGALSTARAGYALCDFNEAAIKAMADLVRRAFMAKGDVHKGIQFLAAQEDAEKPNPLKDVPMPTVTEEQKEQLFQGPEQDAATLILAYIYIGENSEALSHAITYMSDAGADDAVKSLMEVARVLKAIDLNVVRANQFIEFARTGEGQNPLAAIWEELE